MRIEQLQALKKISETHSLNRAAQSMFLTHQALSVSIQNLEKELGTTLLHRSRAGVSLTEDGEFILENGEKMLEVYDTIQARFLNRKISATELPSMLRVSCTGLAQSRYMAKPVSYFYKTFPHVSIETYRYSNAKAIQGVLNGSLDFAFVTEYVMNNRSSLNLPSEIQFFLLDTSDVGILCSKYSPLAPYPTLSLKQLLGQSFVYNQKFSSKMTQFFFQGYPTVPSVLFASSESQFMQMIADNNAISFYVDYKTGAHTRNDLESQTLVKPLQENARMSLGLIFNRDTFADNQLGRIFVDHIL